MLHSDPGVGKSICALDLAFCVGPGFIEWCGYKIERQARVLYIFSEGLARLWKRRDAWLKRHGYTVEDLSRKGRLPPGADTAERVGSLRLVESCERSCQKAVELLTTGNF
jgi:hypothetical protein